MRFWKRGILFLLMAACLLSVSVKAEAASADCPNYSFPSIDGKTITQATNAGKITLIIFAHLNNSHGDIGELIKSLDQAQWSNDPNLAILVVDWANNSPNQIRQFVAPYVSSDCAIKFCAIGDTSFHSFLEATGSADSFSIPMSFLVGADGKIKDYISGKAAVSVYQGMLAPYLDSVDPVAEMTLSITGQEGYADAYKILDMINQQRQANGLGKLQMDKELLEAAMQRAAECAVYYSHTRPDGSSCFTVSDRACAENIAAGYRDAESVMEGWMNSPGHRSNILLLGAVSVGVGVFCHEGIYTWVQLFSTETAVTVKKPADTEKTRQVTTLRAHIVPKAEYALLMVKKGETATVKMCFENQGFDFQKVYPDTKNITFTTSDPEVAKVDAKGVITGVANGTARITMTLNDTNKKVTVTVEVSEHKYSMWKYSAPSCSEPGSARYNCEDCDEWIDREIPALTEHAWDSGTVTKKPTTTKKGETLFTCQDCGETKTISIPCYTAPKPVPTQPATKAPTQPATKAPTKPATNPPTAAPTVPATKAPTAPATAAPTAPPATEQSTSATQPATLATEPILPIPEPTEMPSESLPTEMTEGATEPAESSPEVIPETKPTEAATEAPETQPTQAATEQETAPSEAPGEDPDNKLIVGIVVMAALVVAAGAFLIFWQRRK